MRAPTKAKPIKAGLSFLRAIRSSITYAHIWKGSVVVEMDSLKVPATEKGGLNETITSAECTGQHTLGKDGQRHEDGAQGSERSRSEARGQREAQAGAAKEAWTRLRQSNAPIAVEC